MMSVDLLSLLGSPELPGNVDETFWTGQVIAAFSAAGVALFGAIVSVVAQIKMSRRQQAHQSTMAEQQREHEMKLEAIAHSFSMQQEEMEWRVRQLNELYGPLRMLRATSKRLRQSLPAERLVRRIPEARADPGQKMIVEAILELSRAIETLLISKAGLMEGPEAPESFERFMQHSRLLHLAWEQGDRLTTESGLVDASDVPFPDEIDDDISSAVEAIQAALGKARSGARPAQS